MKSFRTLSRQVRAKGRHLRSKLGVYEAPAPAGNQKQEIRSDIEKCFSVVNRILNCKIEEFHSRSFLLSLLLTFGLSARTTRWKGMKRFSEHQNASQLGTLQYPTELIDFLMECARHSIGSTAEIGVYHGGSAYFSAAVLQRANAAHRYTMIDIEDNLIAFDRFSAVLNLDKRIPTVAADHKKEVFDLVFIDADHSYKGAYGDYHALGKYARKLVGFHDIHAHEYDRFDGGIVQFWKEDMREENAPASRIVEFAHSPERWMGIGLIERAQLTDR